MRLQRETRKQQKILSHSNHMTITAEPVSPLPIEPSNGQGMSVHLSYIRRDVDDLKVLQKSQHIELLQKLNELQAVYPTRKEFDEFVSGFQKLIADHETRVRALEKAMWKWVGTASTIGAVASIIVQLIFKFQ